MEDRQNIKFCFIVSSFNNEKNILKNLTSLITQTNKNWRCIYTNDCSSDSTELLFFDIIQTYNVKSKFTYIKNEENLGQCYSKYMAYKLVDDFEVICILDGDDWLSDIDVLDRLAKIYSDNSVDMVSSNFKIWDNDEITDNTNIAKYDSNVINNKSYRNQNLWKIHHLKTGYAIYFKSIPENYLMMNGKFLRVCTDVAEYYSALEFSKKMYFSTDDVMYIYNKFNSLKYPTSYYRSESHDIHEHTLKHILSLPPCKYSFPKAYIINMAKCDIKREYMKKQMVFQSNTNYKFIDAVDGSTHAHTSSLMKKYYKYMNVTNNSQPVAFDKSLMKDSYKVAYNYSRQHITNGSLGLIQSAFLLMSEFIENNAEHALILEDDVYTLKSFNENFFINEELLKGKDLVYLGCHTSISDIFENKSENAFIDILNFKHLIYGTYSIIISKRLASYILNLGIDHILRLNLSWDLLLNYIRNTETQFTFCLYFKQLFIPNVVKKDGINGSNLNFYEINKIDLKNYYIPDVNRDDNIVDVMTSHTEVFFLNSYEKWYTSIWNTG